MQINDKAATSLTDDTNESKAKAQKKLVEDIKDQWKRLWSERVNDKVKAEDVSKSDYTYLRVERGTVIHASRDFKPLNFKEILEEHMVENPDRYIQPHPSQGGWNKFVKTEITAQNRQQKKYARSYEPPKQAIQQPKKGGRGWLHVE